MIPNVSDSAGLGGGRGRIKEDTPCGRMSAMKKLPRAPRTPLSFSLTSVVTTYSYAFWLE